MSSTREPLTSPLDVEPGDRILLEIGKAWIKVDALARWLGRGGVWLCVVVQAKPGLCNARGGVIQPGESLCIFDHAFPTGSVFMLRRSREQVEQRTSEAQG